MMKRSLTIATVAFLVIALAIPATAGRKGTDRPWKGSVAGHATFEVNPAEACPAFVRTHYVLHGTASHMGKVEIAGTHCPLSSGGHSDGRASITAANGDQLSYEYEHAPGSFSFEFTVTGGTGRFADATGVGTATFTVEQVFLPGCDPDPVPAACFDLDAPWPTTTDFVGTISY